MPGMETAESLGVKSDCFALEINLVKNQFGTNISIGLTFLLSSVMIWSVPVSFPVPLSVPVT